MKLFVCICMLVAAASAQADSGPKVTDKASQLTFK
jgi:hypothetical protein